MQKMSSTISFSAGLLLGTYGDVLRKQEIVKDFVELFSLLNVGEMGCVFDDR